MAVNARLKSTTFMPVTPATRQRIEATIDQLVALLDEIDSGEFPRLDEKEPNEIIDDWCA
ncbi:hypothetical protein D3Y55_15910 [Mesorhizobium sp. DCY119]|nr:hypothetical protein D3Y55_15910 [Mesorhizobium sp. DCY119]